MEFKTKIVETEEEYLACLSIRERVFIREQKVPQEIEVGLYEKEAIYVLTTRGEIPVGCARWRRTSQGVKLERFAVLKNERKHGIGTLLVNFILDKLDPLDHIYLHAQEHVVTFYEKCGFKVVGNRFIEAGIPHLKMVFFQ
tara:strand:- start:18 stop:440 length:423 start_codon:yes stop_codon:yes gene_type:complete